MPNDTRKKMEDEWFARNEAELLAKAQREHERRLADLLQREREGEARRLRELHYLKCPKCGHDMSARHVEEIEVEECGACGGLFFDRGELDAVLLKQAGDRRGFFRKLMGF